MDIAVVDDEKAIREHICALIEEQQPGSVIEAYATGVKEYVFDALDLYAFQYLLKPIDEGKFAEALQRAAWNSAGGVRLYGAINCLDLY